MKADWASQEGRAGSSDVEGGSGIVDTDLEILF